MTGKIANMSNYPNGFQSGILMRDLPIAQSHAGKVFYVADGDTVGNTPSMPNRKGASDGNKGTFLAPFKTLDYAIGQCLADRNDTIIVLPGYVDTLAAASEIDADVDGISIIGVGAGDKQPLIQFDAAAATFVVDADNVNIEGLHFAASVTVVAVGVDVVDGSDDYRIANCRFTSLGGTLTTDEFEDSLSITTSDRFMIENNYFDMDEGADADSAIHLVGVCLGGTIRNNYVTGDYTVGCIESITAAQEQILIEDNTLINGVHGGLNTVACVSLLTGTTGFAQNNQLYTNVTAAVTAAFVADGFFFGGGNWVQTSAETAPIPLEGGASQLIRSTVATGKADETDGLALFTVVGNIYVHGITQRAEVAANSASTLGVQVDATDTTLDSVLVTDTDVGTAETSVGDYAVSAAAGGAFTVVQVEDTTTSVMWNTPVVVPAGSIEQASAATAGALVSGYIIYWSEATAGATCVAA